MYMYIEIGVPQKINRINIYILTIKHTRSYRIAVHKVK